MITAITTQIRSPHECRRSLPRHLSIISHTSPTSWFKKISHNSKKLPSRTGSCNGNGHGGGRHGCRTAGRERQHMSRAVDGRRYTGRRTRRRECDGSVEQAAPNRKLVHIHVHCRVGTRISLLISAVAEFTVATWRLAASGTRAPRQVQQERRSDPEKQ
jgi:hypothetical protein